MLTDDDFELLRRHTDAENAHRLEDTLATLTTDCVFEDVALGGRRTGHAGATDYYRTWWQAFDVVVDVENIYPIIGQPMVAVETTWRGTHVGTFLHVEPTGREIAVPVAIIARLRDGLLHEERLYWDKHNLLEQLGVQHLLDGCNPGAAAQ